MIGHFMAVRMSARRRMAAGLVEHIDTETISARVQIGGEGQRSHVVLCGRRMSNADEAKKGCVRQMREVVIALSFRLTNFASAAKTRAC